MLVWLPSLLLLLLLAAGGRRVASSSSPASSVALQSTTAAAEGRIDDLLPQVALAVALTALDEIQPHDMLSDGEAELAEEPVREKSTRRKRRKHDINMYACLGAAAQG